jgi:MoaA/NifB/PqqE/SkfB family radical SAM enzyme
MIAYQDIRSVHLEISTRCNAACPDCPRNFRGVDIVDTYPLLDMKLDQVQKIFPVEFVQQLKRLLINGNYGDFVTATDGLAIVEYFRANNANLEIEISTNASARPNIWQRLGELRTIVDFRLDGLADTHALYRQNTDFEFILDNARKFIAAGGTAVWAMIPFDHNRHQIESARKMSQDLGFARFALVDAGRNVMPVFTRDQRLSHVIGDYRGNTDFDSLYDQFNTWKVDPGGAVRLETANRSIDCYTKREREIYVCANGEVYPCCWLGFYPQHSVQRPSNLQLQPMIARNNALEYGIEEAIKWFNGIEESWDKTVPEGKIYGCNETCGIR